MSNTVLEEPNKSVLFSAIGTTNLEEPKEDYTHAIELELVGASIPRIAHWTPATLRKRCLLWNVSSGIVALTVFIGQKADYIFGTHIRAIDFSILLVCMVLTLSVKIILCESKWKRDLFFLREGVAVHGLVRRCEVIDMTDIPRYRIHYTYWIGGQTCKGTLIVGDKDCQKWISGNLYFTVLYNAADPMQNMPYSEITSARLAAAPSK